jgi:hypothetical protein
LIRWASRPSRERWNVLDLPDVTARSGSMGAGSAAPGGMRPAFAFVVATIPNASPFWN